MKKTVAFEKYFFTFSKDFLILFHFFFGCEERRQFYKKKLYRLLIDIEIGLVWKTYQNFYSILFIC